MSENKKAEIGSDKILDNQKAAAKYAEVSERTIRRWVKDGMTLTANGKYIGTVLLEWKRQQKKVRTIRIERIRCELLKIQTELAALIESL